MAAGYAVGGDSGAAAGACGGVGGGIGGGSGIGDVAGAVVTSHMDPSVDGFGVRGGGFRRSLTSYVPT